MSRAFVKGSDDGAGNVPPPDRSISPRRNLVIRRGLRLIKRETARYRSDLAGATATTDRGAIGRAARELRYRTAWRATTELVEPSPATDRDSVRDGGHGRARRRHGGDVPDRRRG